MIKLKHNQVYYSHIADSLILCTECDGRFSLEYGVIVVHLQNDSLECDLVLIGEL